MLDLWGAVVPGVVRPILLERPIVIAAGRARDPVYYRDRRRRYYYRALWREGILLADDVLDWTTPTLACAYDEDLY